MTTLAAFGTFLTAISGIVLALFGLWRGHRTEQANLTRTDRTQNWSEITEINERLRSENERLMERHTLCDEERWKLRRDMDSMDNSYQEQLVAVRRENDALHRRIQVIVRQLRPNTDDGEDFTP